MIKENNCMVKSLFNVYIFLFVFTMYNREFVPFNIDLRYFLILISGIFFIYIGWKLFLKIKEVKNLKDIIIILVEKATHYPSVVWFILLFYFNMIISNIMWLFNGLIYNTSDIKSSIILNSTNLIVLLIIYLLKDNMNNKVVKNSIIISHIVLLISILLVWKGYSLSEIMGGEYPGYYGGLENSNFFGHDFRLAGYAQDPNYASFFMVISFFTGLYFIQNRYVKYAICLSSVFGFLLSGSRTIALAIISSVIFVFVWKKLKDKNEKFALGFVSLFVIAIAVVPYLVVKIMTLANLNFNLNTMSTRLSMWDTAVILFEKSPWIGNGLTSFRSFYEASGGWYVQAHSTILQILSENGIIGMVLFTIIFILLMKCKGDYKQYLCFIFLVFGLTSELVYLSIFPFIIGAVAILNYNNYENGEKFE